MSIWRGEEKLRRKEIEKENKDLHLLSGRNSPCRRDVVVEATPGSVAQTHFQFQHMFVTLTETWEGGATLLCFGIYFQC